MYIPRNKKFVEDNFDLESYRDNHIKSKYRLYMEKSGKYLNLVSVFIFIMTILIGYFLFVLGNYYIISNKTNIIANEVEEKFFKTESARVENDSTLEVIFGTKSGTETAAGESGNNLEIEEGPRGIVNSFQTAKTKYGNDDIIGGVKIPDSNIVGYVVQGADNDFYLNRDLYKEPSIAGTLFLDQFADVEHFTQNTIIYGHNMNNGTMFNNIGHFRDKSYFDSHKIIYLNTLYENTEWEIFSFHVPETNFNYIRTDFGSDENFANFIEEIKNRSYYQSDLEVLPTDRILTLSTCSNQQEDTRFVVHAKLINRYIPSEADRIN